jgi:peptide/nickel transport system substrate-binding protein
MQCSPKPPSHRTWLRNRCLAGAASLAVVVAVAGCSAGSSATTSSAKASASSTLTISVSSPPLSLDPAQGANNADSTIFADLAYEPLIILSPTGALEPGLATSWKYAGSSKKVFDLTLRSGVKFSNGQPLTAAAVVASINWQKKAAGPEVVYVNNVASAQATGPLTVQLNLVQPNPVIAFLLTQRFVFGEIIAPAGTSNPKTLGTKTLGAGEYMLDASQTIANSQYVYVANPNYYDKSAVHFKSITVKVITNAETALSAIESGQVAYADGAYATASAAKSEGVAVYAALEGFYGAFLLDRGGALVPALKSQQVRQALNYATDRAGIVKALFGAYGQPNDEVSIPGYQDEGFVPSYANYYAYNPAKAKQLLAQAGYPHGFTMSIGAVSSCGNGVEVAQALASDWAKIGVTVKVKTYSDVDAIVAPWEGKKLPATMCNYDAQPMFIEANQLLAPNAGIFNIFRSSNPVLNSLIAKAYAASAQGPAAVAAAWAAVEREVVVLGWEIPVATGADIYFASKSLKGIQVSPTSFVPDPGLWHY